MALARSIASSRSSARPTVSPARVRMILRSSPRMLPKAMCCELCGHTHAARRGENLLEVQGLRSADDIPYCGRVPSPDPVFDGRKIGCGIEKSAIALANDYRLVRQSGDIPEKDAEGSLAHLGHALRRQPVAKRRQGVIVEAFAQAARRNEYPGGRRASESPSRTARRRAARLSMLSGSPCCSLTSSSRAALRIASSVSSRRVDLPVEPNELRRWRCFQGPLIKKMLPTVNDLAKLRSPIADVIVGDHVVAQENAPMRARQSPRIVLRMCPTCIGLATFGELKSMMIRCLSVAALTPSRSSRKIAATPSARQTRWSAGN